MLWIWIAAVVFWLLVLGFCGVRLLGRLGPLRRAAAKLPRRQAQALRLQEGAAVLEETVLGVQQRAEILQEKLAALTTRD